MNSNRNIHDLLSEAWQERRENNYEAARALVAAAHDICSAKDYPSLGQIFHIYRQLAADQGQLEKALPYSQQSVQYYEKAQMSDKLAHSTRHLADLQRELGLLEQAEKNYRNALAIYRSQADIHPGTLANALRGFGLLLEALGKKEEAITVWKETQALYKACGIPAGVEEAQQKLNTL